MNPADLFRQDSDPIVLAPGQPLFREGDYGEEMFVLLEGEANILAAGKLVDHVATGAIVGEMALIDKSPRSASVIALTPCRLAKINMRRFNFLVQQNPFFAIHVMQVLAQRLRKMNQLVGTAAPVMVDPAIAHEALSAAQRARA